MKRGTPVIYLIPAGLHACLIFFLSSQSHLPRTLHFRNSDKLIHSVAFAVLAFLLAWGLSRGWPHMKNRTVLIISLIATVLYGVSDEFHQRFVPFRESDPMDLLADTSGAALVAVLWWLWRRRRERQAGAAQES